MRWRSYWSVVTARLAAPLARTSERVDRCWRATSVDFVRDAQPNQSIRASCGLQQFQNRPTGIDDTDGPAGGVPVMCGERKSHRVVNCGNHIERSCEPLSDAPAVFFAGSDDSPALNATSREHHSEAI